MTQMNTYTRRYKYERTESTIFIFERGISLDTYDLLMLSPSCQPPTQYQDRSLQLTNTNYCQQYLLTRKPFSSSIHTCPSLTQKVRWIVFAWNDFFTVQTIMVKAVVLVAMDKVVVVLCETGHTFLLKYRSSLRPW
ncbi:unnamed protein product [Absidia cylindrospora]